MNEKRREIKEAITAFIMKICTKERYIEIRRQILCDKNDFEPYVAFKRLTRDSSDGINHKTLIKFQKENMNPTVLNRAKTLINHYRAPISPNIKYKQFLEIVLPRENADLRAFITQRECFDIKKGEYLSYDTELALASLLKQEINIFSDLEDEKSRLDGLGLSPGRIIFEVDKKNSKDLNFQNLKEFLGDSGIAAFDNELISFLRRVDRDDDGVINLHELERFLKLFDTTREGNKSNPGGLGAKKGSITQEKLRSVSPARIIVKNPVTLIPKATRKSLRSRESKKVPRTPVKSDFGALEKRRSSKEETNCSINAIEFCLLNRSSMKKDTLDMSRQESTC